MRFAGALPIGLRFLAGAAHASSEPAACWVHKSSGGLRLQTHAVSGSSDGSADWGLGG